MLILVAVASAVTFKTIVAVAGGIILACHEGIARSLPALISRGAGIVLVASDLAIVFHTSVTEACGVIFAT
jgi:hypothetical protein